MNCIQELNVLAESEVEVRPIRVDLDRDIAWDDQPAIPAKTRLYCRPSVYVPTGHPEIQRFASGFFRDRLRNPQMRSMN